MIPRIIHQTAPTKNLSWEEGRLARRLRRFLPCWEYRLWDDEDNDGLVRSRFQQYADAFAAISRGVAKAAIALWRALLFRLVAHEKRRAEPQKLCDPKNLGHLILVGADRMEKPMTETPYRRIRSISRL